MQTEKFVPNSISVNAILGLISAGTIAIPEIQRPFVWKKTQVRDALYLRLMQSAKGRD